VTSPVAIGRDRKGRKPALIILATVLGPLIQEIDSMVVGVSLPHMQGTFNAAPDQISWVLTSFLIGVAVAMPATGPISSIFGRKRVLIWAIIGFTITSVLAGLSGSLTQMVPIRFVQGVFSAALTPLSMSTLLSAFHRKDHGLALGWWGVGIMIAPVIGPTLGALIAEHFTWRGVFFFNVPLGLFACAVISAYVPETEDLNVPVFSYSGFLMIAFSVGSLQYILDQGEQLDWFDAGKIIVAALIAGIAFYGFILNSLFSRNPFLNLNVFKDRNFCAGLLLKVLLSIILVSIVALLPPFLVDLWNYPIITTGLVMAPRGVAMVIFVIVVGYLHKHIDPQPLLAFGMLVMAFSTWLMAEYVGDITPWNVIVVNFIQGVGWSFLFVPLTAATFSTLNPRYLDVAAGMYGLIGNLGKSVGVSILIGFLVRNIQANRADLVNFVSPFNEAIVHKPLPELWNLEAMSTLAALNSEITRQATLMAYANDFRLLTFITLACVPLAFLIRRPKEFEKPIEVQI